MSVCVCVCVCVCAFVCVCVCVYVLYSINDKRRIFSERCSFFKRTCFALLHDIFKL